ncbi:MAG: 1-deoxy-D-xylulose-5-phosphate reductoisomerase [Thermoanaerobaculia bacterium]
MQRLAILGVTGSIGKSTVEVVRQHPERLSITALAAHGRDPDRLIALAEEFRPELVAVVDPEAAARVQARLPPGVRLECGEDALLAAATCSSVDKVVAAIVGAAGLRPVEAALLAGRSVALANKEALVVAGPLLVALARARAAEILPIDSEHVALHQALRCGTREEVRRLVLTASGGPFLRRDRATFGEIAPAEALRHPTWSMGAKISVDSATMMNKGLELIEATHLFELPASAIDVVVHPQSILHSFVEYRDGSWLAQLSVNDMVFPIQYALAWPERWANDFPRLGLAELGALELLPLDHERFPAVGVARRALAQNASAPAVLNAANEVAVGAFLAGRIPFPAIVRLVEAVLDEQAAADDTALPDIATALAWNDWARAKAAERIAALAPGAP